VDSFLQTYTVNLNEAVAARASRDVIGNDADRSDLPNPAEGLG
jgi:hypothetical protein